MAPEAPFETVSQVLLTTENVACSIPEAMDSGNDLIWHG